MKGGFSYCGTDIADLGLEYVPELENTFVYKPSEAEIHEETFDGHHGGYAYGATIRPKEFVLRVCFENDIDRGILARFYSLFKVGKSGKLIFQRRPWCYYYATVTSIDDTELLSYLSGTIKINMKAYYPFGRSDTFVCKRTDDTFFRTINNTSLFENESMVPVMEFSDVTSVGKPIILANPGTERAPVCIVVSGNVGNGIDIRNLTTGQTCGVVGLTTENTTDQNKKVYIDGMNGKTVIVGGGESKPAFLYHDKGFIELEPAGIALRNVFTSYSNNKVTLRNNLEENVVGKFIFVDNKWCKIISQTDNILTIDQNVASGTNKTMIMTLNEITIDASSEMNISIKFIYNPTFA